MSVYDAVLGVREATPFEIKYDDPSHRYWIAPQRASVYEVPSITTILDATTQKGGLPWWGMRVGLASAIAAMGEVAWAEIANANTPAEIIDPAKITDPARAYFTKNDRKREKPRSMVECLTVDKKRSVNHIKEEAGDRGTAIHKVLEDLGADIMPSVTDFPPEHRGWVAAVMQWWLDQEPEIEEMEVITGSHRYGFAGRFDLICRYPDGQRVLTDLKTSKGVYVSHLVQLAGYRLGYRELQGREVDRMEVLHARPDGGYTLVPALTVDDDFLGHLAHMRLQDDLLARHTHVPGLST